MKLIDADALKDSIQVHYNVVEQDCGISTNFADGAISGLNAAMFEVDNAPTIDAIPVEWLEKQASEEGPYSVYCQAALEILLNDWQKEQEANT